MKFTMAKQIIEVFGRELSSGEQVFVISYRIGKKCG